MIDEPPVPAEAVLSVVENEASATAPVPDQPPGDRVVIDLLQLVPPPPPSVCEPDEPDPFNPEIVVCHTSEVSQRLGPKVGPEDDGFASAIPRARIKLSETVEGQANLHNTPVGGFNANGGEVRLKIDF